MGHSRVLHHLKKRPMHSHRVKYPTCPLCNDPMTPWQKVKVIRVNKVRVQVHESC